MKNLPTNAHIAALKPSESLHGKSSVVSGYDFNNGIDHDKILQSMLTTGFQATNLGRAIDLVNSMVDVIVTTAGGVEEDLIKCLAPSYIGDFCLSGAHLRSKGLNRIGNLLVPNDNYCKFEDWILPIFDQLLVEQKEQGIIWTPSKLIARLGKEINDPSSYCYWAYKNDIPVFCPGLTDGSLGDMLYFHSFQNPGLIVDIIQDIRSINGEAVHANPRKTGMIILGGGMPKHHICNANMMRNGADYAIYINTAQEFDGSDSGALPDEAVSWGKIKGSATPVKVHCDATIAFPLLVSQTFAKRVPTYSNENF